MVLTDKTAIAPGRALTSGSDWRSLTAEAPLLAALPLSARRVTRLLTFPPQTSVFRQGDRPHAMFFLLSGEVRLVRTSRAGGEIILQRTRRGFLAEASLDQPAYHCDATAAESSLLLAIPRRAFSKALAIAEFRNGWIVHLTRELRKVRANAERLSLRTARERVLHFIETEGERGVVNLNRSKKDWAAELGLTHEALYRALAQMVKRGELIVEHSRLTLR
jgi:CRP-like cAMP-binding protein